MNDDRNIRAVRKAGIALECAAGALNAIAPRVEAGQSTMGEFDHAVEAHDLERAEFRAVLENVTGESAAAIERWLAL